jgi:hypothetical protein
MKPHKSAAIVAVLLLTQAAFAGAAFAQDASYQTTTQITGGSFVDTLKQVSFLSHSIKDMLAPTSELTMVHGNQKAVVSKDSTEITDLDKECIIRIDNLKKTYTVTTFAEMRQAFANMPKQMEAMNAKLKENQAQMQQAQAQMKAQQPSNIQTSFDVKVNNTGVTKVVNGLNAQEQVVTMTMHVTMVTPPPTPGQPPPPPVDPNAPTSMDYTMTTDTWVAPDPPEIAVLQDFDKRFGMKLMQGVDAKAMAEQWKQMGAQMGAQGNAGIAQLLGGKPGASDAFAQMAKEVAKLKGTRVMEITSMGGLAPAGSPGTASAPPSGPPPSANSVGTQIANDTANQTAAGEASKESGKMGIFGNALTNSTLSAFRRKKSTPPPPPPAPAATPAAAAGATGGMQTVVLMSTTTQKTNFSEEPIPLSVFQIPSGFKKIESPMAQMSR